MNDHVEESASVELEPKVKLHKRRHERKRRRRRRYKNQENSRRSKKMRMKLMKRDEAREDATLSGSSPSGALDKSKENLEAVISRKKRKRRGGKKKRDKKNGKNKRKKKNRNSKHKKTRRGKKNLPAAHFPKFENEEESKNSKIWFGLFFS